MHIAYKKTLRANCAPHSKPHLNEGRFFVWLFCILLYHTHKHLISFEYTLFCAHKPKGPTLIQIFKKFQCGARVATPQTSSCLYQNSSTPYFFTTHVRSLCVRVWQRHAPFSMLSTLWKWPFPWAAYHTHVIVVSQYLIHGSSVCSARTPKSNTISLRVALKFSRRHKHFPFGKTVQLFSGYSCGAVVVD